jgi:hypothetical protein
VSRGSGAYFASSWIVASDRPVAASGSIVLTLPTETPEIRTSASCASCPASLKLTVNR